MASLISIVIPVYNTGPGLKKCLDSALGQTWKDLEVIAVDDASTDGSAQLLARRAEADPRLHVITQEKNSGTLMSRLAGIRAARGEYLMFMDHDDQLEPRILERAYRKITATGADIVHFNADLVDTAGRPVRCPKEDRIKYRCHRRALRGEAVFSALFDRREINWLPWGKLYRAELCRKAAGFIHPGHYVMGDDFYLIPIVFYFARHYEPLSVTGYHYSWGCGASMFHAMGFREFRLRQCSVLPAWDALKEFLVSQNVFESHRAAFDTLRAPMVEYLALLWKRALPDEDRREAFDFLFEYPDSSAIFRAFRTVFSGQKLTVPDLLDRTSTTRKCRRKGPGKTVCFASARAGDAPVIAPDSLPPFQGADTKRWEAWLSRIRENSYDAVIFSAEDLNADSFWDFKAVQTADALAVLELTQNHADALTQDLFGTLAREQLCRFADALILPDEISYAYFRALGFRAVKKADGLQALEKTLAEETSPLTAEELALAPAAKEWTAAIRAAAEKLRINYIKPGPDGESFVPFFRKLDTLFRKLPAGFRKRFFGFLGRAYNRLRGY